MYIVIFLLKAKFLLYYVANYNFARTGVRSSTLAIVMM